MTNGDFNKYATKSGDSINLSEIGDKTFTITEVVDSPYKDGETITAGVKMTTVETWETRNGDKVNKIHTTRRAIVSKVTNPEFLEALQTGETFKVKCPKTLTQPKGKGKPYFDLVAA